MIRKARAMITDNALISHVNITTIVLAAISPATIIRVATIVRVVTTIGIIKEAISPVTIITLSRLLFQKVATLRPLRRPLLTIPIRSSRIIRVAISHDITTKADIITVRAATTIRTVRAATTIRTVRAAITVRVATTTRTVRVATSPRRL